MGPGVTQLIVDLISGGIDGNIAGALLKKFSLGPVGNTIGGLIGGGVGKEIVSAMGMLPGGGGGMVVDIGGSAVGGATPMAIVGAIKNAAANKS
jgi:uncharacterized membrane protein YeaQ/YmgE (transglycosylase-associated protein family)